MFRLFVLGSQLSFVLFTSEVFAASGGKPPAEEQFPQEDLQPLEVDRSPISVSKDWIQRAEDAKFVFEGVVSDISYSHMIHADNTSFPIAYVTFQVNRFYKGSYGNKELTLAFVFGPTLDGKGIMMQSSVPMLGYKDHLILFLNKNGNELNPVDDESFLFAYEGDIYTNESNRVLISKSKELFLGKSKDIDAILNRDVGIKGVNYRYEVSQLPDADEKGLSPLSLSDFRTYLSGLVKPSKEIFYSSKIGDFAKSNYAAKDVPPPSIKPTVR